MCIIDEKQLLNWLKNLSVSKWKNVPLPVCESIDQLTKALLATTDKINMQTNGMVDILTMLRKNNEILQERFDGQCREIKSD